MAAFLCFEGVDGVGKSTQLRLLCEWLSEQGANVVQCRDPGGTALGERIRELLLSRHDIALGARSELLLYMASRAQLVDEVILPALDAGNVVVSDRFLLANIVYQAYAGPSKPAEVRELGKMATDGLLPDLTFLLDMPVKAAVERIGLRELDRMESRGPAFLHDVHRVTSKNSRIGPPASP